MHLKQQLNRFEIFCSSQTIHRSVRVASGPFWNKEEEKSGSNRHFCEYVFFTNVLFISPRALILHNKKRSDRDRASCIKKLFARIPCVEIRKRQREVDALHWPIGEENLQNQLQFEKACIGINGCFTSY